MGTQQQLQNRAPARALQHARGGASVTGGSSFLAAHDEELARPAATNPRDIPAPRGLEAAHQQHQRRPQWQPASATPGSFALARTDSLQFSVDDLRLQHRPSPSLNSAGSGLAGGASGRPGPYRRAMHVPFGEQRQPAAPAQAQPAAVEAEAQHQLLPSFPQQVVWAVQNHLRRSQQLSQAVAAAAAGSAGPAIDLLGLAAHLQQWGLRVALAAPGRFLLDCRAASVGSWGTATPYLVVSGPAPGEDDLLVEPALREYLSITPATPAYRALLRDRCPAVFVGTRPQLLALVSSMAAAAANSFAAQGLELPPWRARGALLGRWLPTRGTQQQGPPSAAAAAAALPNGLGARCRAIAPPHPQPAPGAGRTAAVPCPATTIVGFAAGSAAAGEEPWRGAEPGTFAEAQCRSTPSADGSEAGSRSDDLRSSDAPPPGQAGGGSPTSVLEAGPWLRRAAPAPWCY